MIKLTVIKQTVCAIRHLTTDVTPNNIKKRQLYIKTALSIKTTYG